MSKSRLVKNEIIKNYLNARKNLQNNRAKKELILAVTKSMLPVQYRYLAELYNRAFRAYECHATASQYVLNQLNQ